MTSKNFNEKFLIQLFNNILCAEDEETSKEIVFMINVFYENRFIRQKLNTQRVNFKIKMILDEGKLKCSIHYSDIMIKIKFRLLLVNDTRYDIFNDCNYIESIKTKYL